MKRTALLAGAVMFFSLNLDRVFAQYHESGKPIAFVSGCEVDLDRDGNADSALLIHTQRGYELIVIMRLKDGTKSYVLNTSNTLRQLKCKYASQIKETDAGPGDKNGRVYKIDGNFITLLQPESSEVAYFWLDGEFREIWFSD